jgi:hypothetical protein
MQIGAEAFHVWKFMDITRKVKGLLDMNKLKSWVDKSLTEEKKGHAEDSLYLIGLLLSTSGSCVVPMLISFITQEM